MLLCFFLFFFCFFFFQAEDGIRDRLVTGVQTCALPISGELNSLLIEDIQGNRLIHSFALKERERRRFRGHAEELRVRTLKAMFRWSLYNPVSNFIARSEERRVGKECRSRWSPYQ